MPNSTELSAKQPATLARDDTDLTSMGPDLLTRQKSLEDRDEDYGYIPIKLPQSGLGPCCLWIRDMKRSFCQHLKFKEVYENPPEDHVLWGTCIHRTLMGVVRSDLFQWFILFLIAASTIALMFESPLHKNRCEIDGDSAACTRVSILETLDMAFAVLFALEMILKIFVMGFVGQSNAYLGDSWNVLDFVIVMASVIDLTLKGTGTSGGEFLGVMRVLRAFRPLRLLSRLEGMKVVVNSLYKSLPAMLNALFVTLLGWFIFAIIGVQLFGGRFYTCEFSKSDPSWNNYRDFAEIQRNITSSGTIVDLGTDVQQLKQDYLQNQTESSFLYPAEKCLSSWSDPDPSWTPDKWFEQGKAREATHHCQCVRMNGTWSNRFYNFDNSVAALETLFVTATLEGWVGIMYDAMDATSQDFLPQKNANEPAAYFFLLFILVGSFFFLSLFVGVVFDNFVKLRDEQTGLGILSAKQKRWVQSQIALIQASPVITPLPPGAKPSRVTPQVMETIKKYQGRLAEQGINQNENWRMPFYRVSLSKDFEKFIMGCIVLNVLVMSLSYEGESQAWVDGLEICNYIFTGIFCLECGIKIIGLGCDGYMADNWNKFDFFIVMGSIIELLMELVDNGDGGNNSLTMLRVLRLFRISRLVRLVKSMRRLKTLLTTLIISLPSLVNVGTLLILMYFVFAIMAVNLYAKTPRGECVNSHANFEDFGTSFLTLFRVSTGEDWPCIMKEVCKDSSSLCSLFFLMFVIVVTFVTLNLFIAIILDNFGTVVHTEAQLKQPGGNTNPGSLGHGQHLSQEMIAMFTDAWAKLDPLASGYIAHSYLQDLLVILEPPLGLGKKGTKLEMLKIIREVMIPLHENNRIHFSEVLYSLSERICGAELPQDARITQDLNSRLEKKLPSYGRPRQIGLHVFMAVRKAQKMWRLKVARRRGEVNHSLPSIVMKASENQTLCQLVRQQMQNDSSRNVLANVSSGITSARSNETGTTIDEAKTDNWSSIPSTARTIELASVENKHSDEEATPILTSRTDLGSLPPITGGDKSLNSKIQSSSSSTEMKTEDNDATVHISPPNRSRTKHRGPSPSKSNHMQTGTNGSTKKHRKARPPHS